MPAHGVGGRVGRVPTHGRGEGVGYSARSWQGGVGTVPTHGVGGWQSLD